jgi:hypothetical protein
MDHKKYLFFVENPNNGINMKYIPKKYKMSRLFSPL